MKKKQLLLLEWQIQWQGQLPWFHQWQLVLHFFLFHSGDKHFRQSQFHRQPKYQLPQSSRKGK